MIYAQTHRHTNNTAHSLCREKWVGKKHVGLDRIWDNTVPLWGSILQNGHICTYVWVDDLQTHTHRKCNCSTHSWRATYSSAHERAKSKHAALRKLQPCNLQLLNSREDSHTLSAQKLFHLCFSLLSTHTHTHTCTDTLVALGSQPGPLNCSIRHLFRKVNSPSDSSCASGVCIRFVHASPVCMCRVPIYLSVGWVRGESCFLCVSATNKLSKSEKVRTHQRTRKPSDHPENLAGVNFCSTQLL